MKKDLPKIYANKINKEIKNNEKTHTTSGKEKNITKNQAEQNPYPTLKPVKEQINEIIKKKQYIYRIPVEIETEQGTFITKIIGMNKNSIITLDNKLIKISTIKNIKIKNE